MSTKLVGRIDGARAKCEILGQRSCRATKFVIYHNSCPWRGEFVSLTRAVEAARKGQ